MSDTSEFARGNVSLDIPKGKMFLYEQPELLTKEDHGHLGLSPSADLFKFTRSITSVPLVAAEIAVAQKHYPVVFSGEDRPLPVAVVSLLDSGNMFVDDSGAWEKNCYIPSYLRRHPFAVAVGEEDKFAIVIDRASSAISDNPEHAFFEGGELSAKTREMVEFCGQYEAERRRSEDFSAVLKELELLSLQEVARQGENGREVLATFYSVNVEKLGALSADQLLQLHQSGFLSFIFAQIFSLDTWNKLVDRL